MKVPAPRTNFFPGRKRDRRMGSCASRQLKKIGEEDRTGKSVWFGECCCCCCGEEEGCKFLVGGKKVLDRGSKKIGCGPFVWPKSKLASVPTI